VGRDVEDFSFPERECSFRISGSGGNNRLRDIKRRTDTITLRYGRCTGATRAIAHRRAIEAFGPADTSRCDCAGARHGSRTHRDGRQ
jgi:hypothetical protein